MTVHRWLCALFTAYLCSLTAAFAQTSSAAAAPLADPAGSHAIRLNVVVDTKSGHPVTGLSQKDFTLLDNKLPRPIRSFRVVTPAQEPVRVILLLDAVNTPYQLNAYVRGEVESYLKSNHGVLAQPTAFGILTDKGAEIEPQFTTDGLALGQALEQHTIPIREINRLSQWSGDERLQICLTALDELPNFASTLPGRKIVLWISPGWPLLSGPRIYLTDEQEQQIFSAVVSISTRLRETNITLYNLNPVGVAESLMRADYYESFLQGVSRPSDVMPGNLGLQVISVQSGGLAIESDSDVAGMIRRCLADLNSWYEITFDPAPGDKPNEYHHIEIKLDQRDLVARTRDGYYANPTPFTKR